MLHKNSDIERHGTSLKGWSMALENPEVFARSYFKAELFSRRTFIEERKEKEGKDREKGREESFQCNVLIK